MSQPPPGSTAPYALHSPLETTALPADEQPADAAGKRSGVNLLLVVLPVVLIGLAGWGLMQRLGQTGPMHFWEGGMLADSYRAAHNLPVYEAADSGHATHMYGPLATYVPAVLFRVTGPSFYPARLLSLASFALAMLTVIVCCRPQGVTYAALFALTLMIAVGACAHDFLEPRPDGVSLLLAMLALLLLYRGFARQAWMTYLAGVALMITAIFFKQPSAMICVMPLTAVLLQRPWKQITARQGIMLLLPPTAVLATLAVTATAWPMLFHYLAVTPAQYSIREPELAMRLIRFPLSIPLTWLAVVLYWRERGEGTSLTTLPIPGDRMTAKTAWLIAALLVAFPAGALAAAKQGGMANSMIPAYFAAAALMLHLSRPLELRWRSGAADLTPWTGVAMVLLCLAFLEPRWDSVRSHVRFADDAYAEAVRLAGLPGQTTACPQDPSINAMAGTRVGRSLIFEYDQAGWPGVMPASFFSDLDQADNAITVGKQNDWRCWPLTIDQRDALLRERGFQPIEHPAFDDSVYTLWRRTDRDHAAATMLP
ncbi:hypothetical protein [Lignipirellula cremea]|uniref:Glycosyltransferase RgtA/B/C/D-like domain-containing protein n=1 Tax=Lignipirellula cremea TaxID=2528010 RepID=A0A518DQ05_9BACT|nr:hypothetical protein [Lignipirellula cremea]QDU93884.1 hypothetical protein Pla8534_16690 [Lignipirellula cremea]